MAMNPWSVESIAAFNFFCCPECVYRSKEENSFQTHAIQFHPKSLTLFTGSSEILVNEVKEEVEDTEDKGNENDFHDHFDYSEEEDKENEEIKQVINKDLEAEADNLNDLDIGFDHEGIENDDDILEDDCDFKDTSIQKEPQEKKRYNCLACDKEFPKKSLLMKHMDTAHDNYKCNECGKEFTNHKHLYKHKYLHYQVQCEICQKTVSRAVLNRHMKTVHVGKESRLFACDQCPYTAHAKRYLNEHIKLFHDPSKSNREWRPQRKGEKQTDSSIKSEDTLIEMENCQECDQQIISSKRVIHYKRSHGCLPPGHESGNYMCDQCPAELQSKKSLQNHLKVMHDVSKPLKYTCHECQLDFSGSRYLICHYKKIHNEIPPEFKDQKQYLCDQCPDVFLTKHSLHLHTVRKHNLSEENPLPKRTYKKKEKISQCPHCEKTFRCDRNCKEHIKVVHEKSTPFECDQCSRKFGLKRTLFSHKQIVHAKVNCDVCGQEIYNSFELKRHKAAVHGIIPAGAFHCEQCPLFFRSEKNLKYHIANKHSVNA